MEGETERKGSPGHVPGLRPEMEPLAGMEAAAAGGSPGQEQGLGRGCGERKSY